MSSYHGWTHWPKAEGGTDPIASTAAESGLYATWYTITDQAIPTGTPTIVNFSSAGAGAFGSTGTPRLAGNEPGVHNTGTTTTNYMYFYESATVIIGLTVEWETGNYQKQSVLRQDFHDGGGFTGVAAATFFQVGAVDPGSSPWPAAHGLLAQNPLHTAQPTYHRDWDIWRVINGTTAYIEVEHNAGSNRNVTSACLSALKIDMNFLLFP